MANEVCKPNISPAGRRRRTRIGYSGVLASLAVVGVGIGLHWPWWARVLVFFPAAFAAVCLLQATRNTCVARAMEGTFEHDDFSTTKAAPDEVEASRRVAATIRRDAVLIGLASAAIGYASTFV